MGGEPGLRGWMMIVCGVILLRGSESGWVVIVFFSL